MRRGDIDGGNEHARRIASWIAVTGGPPVPRQEADALSRPSHARESTATASVERGPASPPPSRPVADDFPPPPKWPLVCAITAAAVYWTALIIMALTTANPVTLNRHQILQAEMVVIGRVDSLPKGTVTVEEVWGGDLDAETITVETLRAAGARTGERYLLPLQTVGPPNLYSVVATPLPSGDRLIYPATTEALEQLRALRPPQAE